MRIGFLAAVVIALAAAAVMAQEPSVDAFEFLSPGETTRDEATERLGEPAVSYPVSVLEEQVGVFTYAASPFKRFELRERARSEGKEVDRARIMEWPVENHRRRARLVFRGERLWHAMLPVPAGERTMEALKERYGTDPEIVYYRHHVTHDVVMGFRLLLFRKHGVGYRQGSRLIKILLPPASRQP